MADFKVVGKLVIDDKGQLKVLGKKAKGASQQLDKVGTSAQTADRRLKGAAQASSGSSKNFSKMAQGINGGLVPAYATLAASLFAVSALFRGLETAANIKNQIAGMEQFGAITGKNMALITQSIRDATAGILDFQSAAQAAAITTAAGFGAKEVEDLAEGAKLASVALGRDLNDSFNRLVRGVTKAEPELLDELGIILRLEVATEKFAIANGLAANKLTIAQKAAAVHAEVMGQLNDKYGDFRGTADDLVNPFSKLQTSFNDIIVGLSAFIGPLETVADFLSRNTGAAATLFAGFALSITKSAFPALSNLTAGLTAFRTSAQSNLRATKIQFEQHAATIRKNGATFNITELKKSRTFKKFLAKRKMDMASFEEKSLLNQRRSVTAMINNLKKRQAAGKVINDAELAYFIKTRNQMVGVSAGAYAKMIAGGKIAGTALAAAITVPAAASQVALAGIGTAALKLAPLFVALGSIINAAFFIFTAGFIVKFIYDLLFVTEEYKTEQERLNKALKKTGLELEHINNVGTQILKEQMDKTEDSIDNVNKGLLRTFRLLNGLQGIDAISDFLGDKASDSISTYSRGEKQNIRGVLSNQLAALFAIDMEAFKGTIKDIETQINTLNPNLLLPRTAGGETIIEKIFGLDPEKVAEQPELLTKKLEILMRSLFDAGQTVFMTGEQFLSFASIVSTSNNRIKEETETVGDLDDAYKNLGETLGKVQKRYAAKDSQTFADAASLALEALDARIEKENSGAAKADKIGMLNTALGLDIKTTEDFDSINNKLRAMVQSVAAQPGILKAQGTVSTNISMLSAKKDEGSKMLLRLEKEKKFSLDIESSEDRKNILIAQGIGLKGTALTNNLVEISQEEEKLRLLKLQEKEYIRANTVAGQLNDTFQAGIDEMFLSIINGTASAKDAFKQLAVVVIQEMQRILAVRMASSIIQAMTNISVSREYSSLTDNDTLFDADYGVPDASTRYGGVVGKGYASGGIADGPDSGYNVLMHGREAIVPLPDGDKIPVQLTGKGQGPVNSVINVTVNNEGDVETSAEESAALGEAIQVAVTREISEQQRPGGLLSPI